MYKTSTTTGTKNNKSFEQILIEERAKRGLSLREASAQIGIAHTYLSSLEKGADPRSGKKLTPSPDVVFKICKAYDLDFSEAIPYITIRGEYDFYLFLARKINALKKTNPRQYKNVLEIITGSTKE